MGFSIALDDLGAGYSSLRLWSELRPDYVKIDRHFVDGIHLDTVKREFVGSILKMARASRAQVIAEGIELPEELAVLSEMGSTWCKAICSAARWNTRRATYNRCCPALTPQPVFQRRARRPACAAAGTARGRRSHLDPGSGGNLPPPGQPELLAILDEEGVPSASSIATRSPTPCSGPSPATCSCASRSAA